MIESIENMYANMRINSRENFRSNLRDNVGILEKKKELVKNGTEVHTFNYNF